MEMSAQALSRMLAEAVAKVSRESAAAVSRREMLVERVGEDGTLDLNAGSPAHQMILYGVRATTACAGVEAGDTVLVETVSHVSYATGVIARSSLARASVDEYEAGGWHVTRVGDVVTCSTVWTSPDNAYVSDPYGSGYASTEYFTGPGYPVEFAELPALSVDYVGADEHYAYAAWVELNINSATTRAPGRWWLNKLTSATIGHPRFSIMAMGRAK